MKIVIIPSHNQVKHIPEIIQNYEKQTLLPDLLLFVLDRCKDNSEEILRSTVCKLRIEYITKETGENFSAGLTRDFGVEYIQKNYPEYEMIVFTDGDCIPSNKLIELHYENIKQSNKSIVSCGMRNKQKESGEWEIDERLSPLWINEFSFNDKNSRLIVSNQLTLDNIFTYSCNFAFNKNAIELCQNINVLLSNSKRVFNPEFDGSWGGEDSFVSHCLYRTGNYILLTTKDCYVDHFWHIESSKIDKNKKLTLQKTLSKKLERLILNNKIDAPIQTVKKAYHISFGPCDTNNEIKNCSDVSGLDSNISFYIDHICEKYSLERLKNVFRYFLTNNIRTDICESSIVRVSDYDIYYCKQLLGYMKFYLVDDVIEFVDDVDKFKLISSSGSFLEYSSDK